MSSGPSAVQRAFLGRHGWFPLAVVHVRTYMPAIWCSGRCCLRFRPCDARLSNQREGSQGNVFVALPSDCCNAGRRRSGAGLKDRFSPLWLTLSLLRRLSATSIANASGATHGSGGPYRDGFPLFVCLGHSFGINRSKPNHGLWKLKTLGPDTSEASLNSYRTICAACRHAFSTRSQVDPSSVPFRAP